jgi:hypothetical protein
MLLNVVDQCLSMALASAARHASLPRTRAVASGQRWNAPLAAYPRLRAAMEKAEAEGVIPRRGRMH